MIFLVNQVYEFVMVCACFNVYVTAVWFLVLIGLHGSHLVLGMIFNLVIYVVYIVVDGVTGVSVSDVSEIKVSSNVDFTDT
jgi:heme/copper-type cytochrome/quinol oxidase subunit 3